MNIACRETSVWTIYTYIQGFFFVFFCFKLYFREVNDYSEKKLKFLLSAGMIYFSHNLAQKVIYSAVICRHVALRFTLSRPSTSPRCLDLTSALSLLQAQCQVTDLYEDLRDGHNLITLLEVLSGKTLVSPAGCWCEGGLSPASAAACLLPRPCPPGWPILRSAPLSSLLHQLSKICKIAFLILTLILLIIVRRYLVNDYITK